MKQIDLTHISAMIHIEHILLTNLWIERRQNELSILTRRPRSDFDSLTNYQLDAAIHLIAKGKTWKFPQS